MSTFGNGIILFLTTSSTKKIVLLVEKIVLLHWEIISDLKLYIISPFLISSSTLFDWILLYIYI